MKVLQVNIVCGKYSTGTIATSIADVLAKNGDDCYIAYDGTEDTWYENSYRIGNVWTQRIHNHIFSKMFDAQGYGSYFDTRRFLKWVDRYQPDVIHLHNIHGCYINYPLLFGYINKKDIPVVWTIHDCWPTTGHCTHFFSVNCNKWKEECHHCPLSNKGRLSFVDRSRANYKSKKKYFTLPKRMVLTPVSKWMGNVMKEGFLSEYPLEVIYNGIDLSLFKPVDSSLRHDLGLDGKFVILGVASSWNKEKGVEDYIELSRQLDAHFQIVLLGMTPEQIKALPKSIIGFPRTASASDLAKYYTMADVVTSLSYGESMGLTPIEGMACGTPAIVYDNTAQPELISKDTGFVVPTGNICALVDKIKLIEERLKNEREQMSEACFQWVSDNFDREKQYRKYLGIYKRLF